MNNIKHPNTIFENKFQALKAAINEGLASGISDQTADEVRKEVILRLGEFGRTERTRD
ncbi:MAG: hypothetical protein JKY49_11010 [Cohaesibacteraceae bacterium]|nr:hypothetical protein [Cohaesibacteraceae bacterium]MBL4875291.1 hypothetical protein [Cohaesibacteraceae bacterium]